MLLRSNHWIWAVLFAGIGVVTIGATAGIADEKADSVESRYLTGIRQVTRGFTKAGEGYFSPDGESIIYQAVPRDYLFYQIYTQKLAGGEPTRISTGRGRTTCSFFSPDGSQVIFASSHLDPKLDETESAERKAQAEAKKSGRRRRYSWVFDSHMDVFRAGLDGSNRERLTRDRGYDAECSYSPDGKQIVFASDRDGDVDLYIMAADGSGVRQLTNSDGYDGGPFFSPDGRWIIYRTDRKQENYLQIHAISVNGKRDVELTRKPHWVNWAPYWHPGKPYIIWCGADHTVEGKRPNYDLWLLRYKLAAGRIEPDGAPIRITDNPAADVLPVFSPDGKRLMWTSTRTKDRSSQLWIADFRLPAETK